MNGSPRSKLAERLIEVLSSAPADVTSTELRLMVAEALDHHDELQGRLPNEDVLLELGLIGPGGRSWCPFCQQRVRKLNRHAMDRSKWHTLHVMAQLHRQGHPWIKTEEGRALSAGDAVAQTSYRAGQHASRLKWFGLVEHQGTRTGMYRVTAKGYLFLAGQLSVPETIYCRDGHVFHASMQRVTVSEIKGVVLNKAYWDSYGDHGQVYEPDEPTGPLV